MKLQVLIFLLGFCTLSATPHSEPFLSAKQRDFWWNHDYLELIEKRVDFSEVKSALDVGCGKGAWTWVISSVLPESAKIIGIDRESLWIESITPPSNRFSFVVGDANALPFEDESFDLVTCQTLLIHMSDPRRVLSEMARVLKPGGFLVLSEPTNMANLTGSNSAQQLLSLEESVDAARLFLTCQKGQEVCGDGFLSLGLHLNYLLPSNISHLHSFMAEKMMVLTPPYQSQEEAALLNFVQSLTGDDVYYCWSKDKAQKYFFAVYPDGQQEFDRLWKVATKLNQICRQQIQERKLAGVFGGHLILTIGKKESNS